MVKMLEQLKFKLSGRSIPVIKCQDVDVAGRIGALQMIRACKDRPNSIMATWNGEEWEKDPEYPPITVTDDRGIAQKMWVVSEAGKSCPLYTRMSAFPNREKLIGNVSNLDDFTEALGIKPSMRDKIIFLLIGIVSGVFVFQPMLAGILS